MFNFSSLVNAPIANNAQFQFSVRHSMALYNHNSIYTFIPKNGCSSLRLSVAIANGFLQSKEQVHWIHQNNQTFKPSQAEMVNASYKFIILRCPYRRLASVYLDKFVSKEVNAWHYRDALNRECNLDDLSFSDFVHSLKRPAIKQLDPHWKPQSHFLLYKEYDDYFSLENFSYAVKQLKDNVGLDVIDARSLTGHGTDKYVSINNESFSDTAAFDIALLKRKGKCPSYESLYNPELVDLVKKLYSEDFTLYKSRCDETDLLFQ
ncbi:sulfotransferase family 2 domain-containing protein [Shewanella benthica]|uniref:sulfotransferase family 2 domain-containing protein n=1 Tax=Shewanella benthica TaxID=43661 RepID=UPI001D0CFD75|nr:sulfotransferase family 2 domain-containing protein [Shewanella benthica]MBE7213923.1 sulfotransferase family 2 domain-containing protein [Shewanella benthica]